MGMSEHQGRIALTQDTGWSSWHQNCCMCLCLKWCPIVARRAMWSFQLPGWPWWWRGSQLQMPTLFHSIHFYLDIVRQKNSRKEWQRQRGFTMISQKWSHCVRSCDPFVDVFLLVCQVWMGDPRRGPWGNDRLKLCSRSWNKHRTQCFRTKERLLQVRSRTFHLRMFLQFLADSRHTNTYLVITTSGVIPKCDSVIEGGLLPQMSTWSLAQELQRDIFLHWSQYL